MYIYHSLTQVNRYLKIIKRAIDRQKSNEFEGHHILPRHLFPELINDARNIVYLTFREHFIAHRLLFRAFPTEKMAYGFWAMSNRGKIKNSRDFENSRKLVRHWLSENRKGENNPMFGLPGSMRGRKHTEETKKRMSESHLGSRRDEETKERMSRLQKERGGYGPKVFTEEQKQRMSLSHIGIIMPERTAEHKENLSKSLKGKPKTIGFTGKTHSETSKKKASITQLSKNLEPWEIPSVYKNQRCIDLWKQLDVVYNAWIKTGCKGHRRICTYMDIPLQSSIEYMVGWFRKNGNPDDYQKWVEFRNG